MHKIGLNRKDSASDQVSVNPKNQCTQARPVHRLLWDVPQCALIFWRRSEMCIDFLVKFHNVHRFWWKFVTSASIFFGKFHMCIDFPRKFPTCTPLFLGKFPTCGNRFSGESPYVFVIFERKLPTRCPSIYRGGLPTCLSISGRSS